MLHHTSVAELSSQLYAAAAAPEKWPSAMQRITNLLRCEHGILLTRASWQGEEVFWASAGLDAHQQIRFRSSYCAELASPLFQAAPIGIACSRDQFISDRHFEDTAFYNEIVRPANGFRSLNAALRGPGTCATLIGFCRPRTADEFDAQDAALLQELLPHIATTLELSIRLRVAEDTTRSFRALVDAVEFGIVLVDAAAHPHFINRRAAHLLAQRDGLAITSAGFTATAPAKAAELRETVAEVARQPVNSRTRRLCVARRSLGSPLLLSVLPVSPYDGPAFMPAARAVIFIAEPGVQARIDPEFLAESFRLTRREAAVAALLAGGLDLKGVAEALHLGIGTVRTHLKHVFEKTDTRSQTALVRKLQSFGVQRDSPSRARSF
jgi:DNA-binding CsgD family transcriptional regulator/PAS domain-containing protein